jgi:rod shape determining protein RodA
LNILLLLGVLMAGRYALGAKRWMELGDFSFQPSEMMKLTLILALGRYFGNRRPSLSFNLRTRLGVLWGDLAYPFLLTMLPMVLIFKQPDLGTAFLIFGVFLVMLFASGLEYRYILCFLIFCASALPVLWHFLKEYQKMRLLVFLNPNIDPLGAGYTIIQSRIAVGSGGLLGKGWLAGTQNQLNFLPERHTDFIFSVIGEEWGLVGTIFTIGCFYVLAHSGLRIVKQQKDRFGMLVTAGIVGILTLQVVINVGMVMGLCPVVGITLPFISYGRSSFMVFVIMMGFLLNLSKRRTVF